MIKIDALKKACDETIGREVWAIVSGWTPCPECNGRGRIDYTAKSGEQYGVACPVCGGKGSYFHKEPRIVKTSIAEHMKQNPNKESDRDRSLVDYVIKSKGVAMSVCCEWKDKFNGDVGAYHISLSC